MLWKPEHGDGTKANLKIPDYSGSELPVNFAGQVFYCKLNSQPGLVICHGKTNHSYNWFHIAPSPVASRMHLNKDQSSEVNCFVVVVVVVVVIVVWSRLMGQVWPAAIVVWHKNCIHSFIHMHLKKTYKSST